MTQDIKDVLNLALDALDNLMYWDNGKPDYDEAREAITAIKEALAQPQQEPVAWINPNEQNARKAFHWVEAEKFTSPVYTSQPQRTWVGLTDEEKSELWEISRAAWPRYVTYASLAEAKLKQKNT